MRVVINIKEKTVTTNEGMKLVRRVTTVRMPNGIERHPVDYYDPTPGTIKITRSERNRIRIPVYKQLI